MQHRNRAIWILVFLGCGFTVISFNLIQIQLVQHDKYWHMAEENHTHRELIPPKRGAIYDGDGNILAQTQRVYDIRLDGQLMNADHPETNLSLIAQTLQVAPGPLVASFNAHNRNQLIAQDQDDGMIAKLATLKIKSLIFNEHDRRVYPNNELGAHVLGFVDDNGHGVSGMEKQMDPMLCGKPGERLVEQDAKKHEIAVYQDHETPAVDGDNVTLTIKMAIQHVVEDQLDQIVQTYKPNAADIIVMDPQTGEILAMGSRPNYDPNNRADLTPDRTRDRCITDPVEPGSVFKIITLAGALNEGLINLDTQIFCENGAFFYAGRELHDDDEHHAWLPVEEVMSQSKQVTDEAGNVVKAYPPQVVRQVITANAAAEVARALEQVTIDGTAKNVHIQDSTGAGWSFAGKTGTAQKFVNGEYSHTQHVASFIGFMPAEDPAFVALVMVDDPKTAARQDYGAEVSAPVFANIAKQVAQIMNIPTDLPAPIPATPIASSTSTRTAL
jgi:cell division protein FtsI/penicillin-binding protein 2